MIAPNLALSVLPIGVSSGALAQEASQSFASPLAWIGVLALVALLPVLATMFTSFAKLAIVGGIIRHAIGTPSVPPTSVITGLALLLSVHIMSPVAMEVWEGYREQEALLAPPVAGGEAAQDFDRIQLGLGAAVGPVTAFLTKHASEENVELFSSLHKRLQEGDQALATVPATGSAWNMVSILAPAFILTELTEAFQIGFLILVPFLVIDLVVSNLLLAMGMHMLSPITISLPLKLLLFVLIDGWNMILQGTVLGYVS